MDARTHIKCTTTTTVCNFDAFNTKQATKFGRLQNTTRKKRECDRVCARKKQIHNKYWGPNTWMNESDVHRNGNKRLSFPNISHTHAQFIDSHAHIDTCTRNNYSKRTHRIASADVNIYFDPFNQIPFISIWNAFCQIQVLQFLHTRFQCLIVWCSYLFGKMLCWTWMFQC